MPRAICRRLGNAHDSANVFGHGVVKPASDALVDHDPVRITAVGAGGRRSEVRAETELADEGVEEASPLGVVRLGEIELDGNVVFNVHRL